MLLILDNCEHLLDACAQLTDTLLKHCPNLKILATSRESLGITGEAVYPVPSLALPDFQQLLDNFREYESVSLFEERAQLAQVDFSLTLENAASVAQICHRLDGIPLAIELAAAHVNMFSTEQIAARLNESFNLLTGGSRTALPRQQTIRASIEWSWDLLSDSEKSLLRRLSVFAGGWTLEAVESLCNGDGLNADLISKVITQLVKKSLVMVNQVTGGATRYHFHEMIRQYTNERLVEAGELETIHSQHLKYFLMLSEAAEPALRGPDQIRWLARLNDEYANMRAALEWADKTDVEAGLYLASRLNRFWESFDMREGAHWLVRFIEKSESQQFPLARAKALFTRGWQLFWSDKADRAHVYAQECLKLYKLCNDKHGEVDALTLLGAVLQGETAMELFQQALSLSQLLKDPAREARVLSRMGSVGGDYRHKIAYFEKAVKLFRELGDLRSLAGHLGVIGNLELLSGNFDAAQEVLDEAVQLNRQLNNKATSNGNLLIALSRLEAMKGNFEKGRAFLEEDISMAEELGNRMYYLWSRAHLGYLTLREGKATQAYTIFAETTQEFHKDQSEIGIVFTLEGLASLNIVLNRPERASQLLGWADTTREKIHDPRPPLEQTDVDRDIAAITEKIGSPAYEKAYDAGRAMTLDEAVALALVTKD